MGVSENTVKSRLNYGRKAIEKGVKEYEKQGIKLYGLSPLPSCSTSSARPRSWGRRRRLCRGLRGPLRRRGWDSRRSGGRRSRGGASASAGAAAGTGAAASASAGAAAGAGAGAAAAAAGAATGTAAAGLLGGLSVKVVAAVVAGAVAVGGAAVGVASLAGGGQDRRPTRPAHHPGRGQWGKPGRLSGDAGIEADSQGYRQINEYFDEMHQRFNPEDNRRVNWALEQDHDYTAIGRVSYQDRHYLSVYFTESQDSTSSGLTDCPAALTFDVGSGELMTLTTCGAGGGTGGAEDAAQWVAGLIEDLGYGSLLTEFNYPSGEDSFRLARCDMEAQGYVRGQPLYIWMQASDYILTIPLPVEILPEDAASEELRRWRSPGGDLPHRVRRRDPPHGILHRDPGL